jgi:hypothetical protein
MLTRGYPPSKDDCREAGDVRSMNLPSHHKNADFRRLSAMIDAAQEHVEAAFVGTERVE